MNLLVASPSKGEPFAIAFLSSNVNLLLILPRWEKFEPALSHFDELRAGLPKG